MGYTHYWRHDLKLDGKALFAAFQDARKIVEAAKAKGIQLRGGGGEGEPVIEEAMWLNGAKELEEDCETFAFPVTGSDLEYSLSHDGYPNAFCKTQRLPYDVVVCAILLVLKHHLGKQIRIASDGEREDDEWLPAERMVQEVLGYKVRFQSEREYFKRPAVSIVEGGKSQCIKPRKLYPGLTWKALYRPPLPLMPPRT